jgi:WD40 repeat protein
VSDIAPTPRHTFAGHSSAVRALAFTPDGTRLVSASDDRTLKVWDLATGAELHTLRGHDCEVRAVAIARHGRMAVSGGIDGALAVWDIAKGSLLRRQRGCRRPVRSIVITPDGRHILAAGGEPYDVRDSWFYTRFNPTLRAWRLDTGKKVPLKLGQRDLKMITALALTADGRRLLADVSYSLLDRVCGSSALMLNRSIVHVWDIADTRGEPRRPFPHEGMGLALAVSRDGQVALTAGDRDILTLWDVESGRGEREIGALHGHSDTVTGLALLPGDTQVLSASRDGALLLWALPPADERMPTLIGRHDGPIHALAATPDGCLAVTGGADSLIRLWDLARSSARAPR